MEESMFCIGINRDHYAVLSYCSMVLLLHKLISYEMIESAKKSRVFSVTIVILYYVMVGIKIITIWWIKINPKEKREKNLCRLANIALTRSNTIIDHSWCRLPN